VGDSALISVGLPVALAIIMFGLGLSLQVDDFRRVARSPRAVVVALTLQVLVLPVIAFGLVLGFGLDPLLAVGVMLLAASPGGTTANLFSHLFHGDVALNVTLTAINSVLAAFTIPLITNLAIGYFDADGELGLQVGKVLQVIAIVLVPVVLGMLVRSRRPALAARSDKPVRVFSIVVLVVVAVGALLGERENLADYVRQVGLVTAIFCAASLPPGYATARPLPPPPPPAWARLWRGGAAPRAVRAGVDGGIAGLGVLDVTGGGVRLVELAPDVTEDEVRERTDADLEVSADVRR